MDNQDPNNEMGKAGSTKKPTFLDRIFALLEGPVAASFVKLIATGIISVTTVAIVGILAFTDAPISLIVPSVGLGTLSIAIVWIFGKWPKSSDSSSKRTLQEIEERLSEFETRLANVEIIERFEDRLATKANTSTTNHKQSVAKTTYSSITEESE